MIRGEKKSFSIVLFILFLTSCSTSTVVKIDQDLKRIDKFDNKNEFIKSYYKKFDRETSQWLLAVCNYSNVKTITLKSNDCDFTDMSLHMISIAKENDNIFESSISNDKKIDTDQEENNQEQQNNNNEEEEEEEEFFEWCGGENCEE